MASVYSVGVKPAASVIPGQGKNFIFHNTLSYQLIMVNWIFQSKPKSSFTCTLQKGQPAIPQHTTNFL